MSLPPIRRTGFSDEIDVVGDMMRPREKRDAILRHVASWGDRRAPIASIHRSPPVLSIQVVRLKLHVRVTKQPDVPTSFFGLWRRISMELFIARHIFWPTRHPQGQANAHALPRTLDPRSRIPRSPAPAQRAPDMVRCRHHRRHDGRRDRGRIIFRIDGAACRRLAYGNPRRRAGDRRRRISVRPSAGA